MEEFLYSLLNRKIDMGYCYDINMVINNYIKPIVLYDVINKDEAHGICSNCSFNQLKSKNQ